MSIASLISNIVRVSWLLVQKIVLFFFDAWMEAFVDKPSQNMNPYVRWELFILGCVLLGITVSIDIPLHWLVLLPLLSIYLIQSATIGFEPLYFLIQRTGRYLHKHSLIPRIRRLPYSRA